MDKKTLQNNNPKINPLTRTTQLNGNPISQKSKYRQHNHYNILLFEASAQNTQSTKNHHLYQRIEIITITIKITITY